MCWEEFGWRGCAAAEFCGLGSGSAMGLVGGVLVVEASKQVYAPTRGGLGAMVRRPLRALEGMGQPAPVPVGPMAGRL